MSISAIFGKFWTRGKTQDKSKMLAKMAANLGDVKGPQQPYNP